MLKTTVYTLEELKNEARCLVDRGIVNRYQPLCVLCEFIPPREWICVECELDRNNYTLKDHICDLLCKEEWSED